MFSPLFPSTTAAAQLGVNNIEIPFQRIRVVFGSGVAQALLKASEVANLDKAPPYQGVVLSDRDVAQADLSLSLRGAQAAGERNQDAVEVIV